MAVDLAQELALLYQEVFPLIVMSDTRRGILERFERPDASPEALVGGVNRIGHSRALSGPETREITTPNSDTVYSTAWIDLSTGPVRLHVPAVKNRYWSVALMDTWTDNFEVIGSRTDGEGPVDLTIVGPDHGVPAGERIVHAPGNDVWLLARWLVVDEADLGAVHAIQDGCVLEAEGEVEETERPVAANRTDPEEFLPVVNHLLSRNQYLAGEEAQIERRAELGIGPGLDVADLDPQLIEQWRAAAVARLESITRANAQTPAHQIGWQASQPDLGRFGSNKRLRAAVALGGLAALPADEVIYFRGWSDSDGDPLSGDRQYRFFLPAGGLACDAFWSLTMYEIEDDGRRFLISNPINRYLINDRTAGLQVNADGSTEIAIQVDRPADLGESNWLPAPSGRIFLALRAYHPRPELNADQIPAIQRIN